MFIHTCTQPTTPNRPNLLHVSSQHVWSIATKWSLDLKTSTFYWKNFQSSIPAPKRFSSSEDVKQTVSSEDVGQIVFFVVEELNPNCDLDLEVSNQNILHGTLAHDHHTKFGCKSYSGSEDIVCLDIPIHHGQGDTTTAPPPLKFVGGVGGWWGWGA